jgi:serine/threonine-protein kinase
VYDEESYQYPTPPKSPIPVAALTSVITTILVFFGLRLLEDRGVFGGGGEAVEVPSVVGMRPEQARDLLKPRNLLLAVAGERHDPRFAAGAIAAQNPLPGSQAPRGTAVQVAVASAAAALAVPNLAGLRAEDALRQLAAAGLQVGPQKTAPSPTVPAGMVIQTEPAAATTVAPQSAVSLVVSAGAPAATVPKVTGLRMTKARTLIEGAGFKVGRVRIGSNEDRMGGVILKQEPAEGATAPAGTAVDLVVNED